MTFIGRFANLIGFALGNFVVQQISGRDRYGAPVWIVICSACRRKQVFAHRTLASALESRSAAQVLFCQNAACRLSRKEHSSPESLADLRRQERAEKEQLEEAARKEQELAAQEAAQQTALRTEKQKWLRFANSQILAGIAIADVMSFETWQRQSDHWREDILNRLGA